MDGRYYALLRWGIELSRQDNDHYNAQLHHGGYSND